ncbi:hypothetical protein NXS19_003472 [Fusarium pseudograminearum]|nr:hypothetical protein NXS19_003472 [Fusarium pseudograminearum]
MLWKKFTEKDPAKIQTVVLLSPKHDPFPTYTIQRLKSTTPCSQSAPFFLSLSFPDFFDMFLAVAPSVYQSPKCFVTHGTMGHVDTKQAPRKGKPWAAITSLDFIHKVDLILPVEVHDAVSKQLAKTDESPRYSRVVMSLGDILQGDFFTEYIKKGDIIMLSEGKTTVDTLFTLREGVLTMYVDKETHERAGIPGKPYGSKGGRGSKPRWTITYNLRDPSMLRGKRASID